MKFLFALLIVAFAGFLPQQLVAHNLGFSIEVVEGPYLLDIGYSPEVIDDATQTRFDFDIYDNTTNESIPFDNIWFRIEKDKKVYFAGGLSKQKFGATGMTYRFPEAGSYDLYVRFSSSSEAIADTTIQFDVKEAPDERPFIEKNADKLVSLVVGVLLGLLLTRFLRLRKA